MSADRRREAVVTAAVAEFAHRGFAGAATTTIARVAGISQPYLFQLYPTKRALFLAVLEHSYADVAARLSAVGEGLSGDAALLAMRARYQQVLRDTRLLQLHMQIFCAALDDEEIRAAAARHFAGLWRAVARQSAAEPHEVLQFFNAGMTLNVLASLDAPYDLGREETAAAVDAWAAQQAG